MTMQAIFPMMPRTATKACTTPSIIMLGMVMLMVMFMVLDMVMVLVIFMVLDMVMVMVMFIFHWPTLLIIMLGIELTEWQYNITKLKKNLYLLSPYGYEPLQFTMGREGTNIADVWLRRQRVIVKAHISLKNAFLRIWKIQFDNSRK